MKDQIITSLKKYIPKENIYLKARCNKAIRDSLEYVKRNSEKRNIIVQDQGGWLRYLDYPQKYDFEIVKVKTNYGMIDFEDLKRLSKDAAALLYENPAGYIASQDTRRIYDICNENDCLVIMDVTGMIAYPDYMIGNDADIIIGSFGKGKPINLGYGGFISFSSEESIEEDFEESRYEELKKYLDEVDGRMKKLVEKVKEVKNDLKDLQVIHATEKGLNVVVKFSSEEEKNRIINYCDENNLEYTECPRYIRVMDEAISIEIKRLEF